MRSVIVDVGPRGVIRVVKLPPEVARSRPREPGRHGCFSFERSTQDFCTEWAYLHYNAPSTKNARWVSGPLCHGSPFPAELPSSSAELGWCTLHRPSIKSPSQRPDLFYQSKRPGWRLLLRSRNLPSSSSEERRRRLRANGGSTGGRRTEKPQGEGKKGLEEGNPRVHPQKASRESTCRRLAANPLEEGNQKNPLG
ncbi:uncharacterized protein [Aegilops tauschii subsp. strangulata]|uniref:uncharacterized protein isoform X2 n=1 Tax=Aegilops tauschii subsp. strangulata TaxID=200361 RepID=UPI003CC86E5C